MGLFYILSEHTMLKVLVFLECCISTKLSLTPMAAFVCSIVPLLSNILLWFHLRRFYGGSGGLLFKFVNC